MTLTKELDLHNVRHMGVQSVMDKFLGEHMMNGNSDNMKKVVDDVLNDYGLTSQSSPLNNGILIIKL